MVINVKKSLSRKLLFVLGSFLFILLAASSVQAATRPIITILNFGTGNPITAGGYFNLDINLSNQGSLCGIGTIISVQPSYPFLTTGVSSSYPVTVCSQTSVTLPLRIDPSAQGGSYPLTLLVSYSDWSNNFYSNSNTITLLVSGKPDLNANIVGSDPINVYPGDTATINVLIENNGVFEAQSIKGILYSNGEAEVKPSYSFMYLSSLDSEQSSNVNFAVDIPKNANTTEYPMTLALQYLNENRELETKNISIVFSIKKKAVFKSSDAKSQDLYQDYSGRTVKFNITNIGTDTANQIKVNIMPQFPFTTDGSVRYIDNLVPGNSSIVNFLVDVDKDATPGNYGIDLIFDYKDNQGNTLQDIETTSLTVKNKGIFRSVFIDYWFIWIILIIIALIFFMRSKRFTHQRTKFKEFINKKAMKKSH